MVCSSHCYRILHHSCFFFNFLFCLPIPLFHHQRNVFCSAPSYCPSPCWWTGLQSFHLQRVCIQILYLPSRQQSQLSLVPLLSENPLSKSTHVHGFSSTSFFFSLFFNEVSIGGFVCFQGQLGQFWLLSWLACENFDWWQTVWTSGRPNCSTRGAGVVDLTQSVETKIQT